MTLIVFRVLTSLQNLLHLRCCAPEQFNVASAHDSFMLEQGSGSFLFCTNHNKCIPSCSAIWIVNKQNARFTIDYFNVAFSVRCCFFVIPNIFEKLYLLNFIFISSMFVYYIKNHNS